MKSSTELERTSKFMSLVLRHSPESVGLSLDAQGWVRIDALLDGAARHGKRISEPLLREVVASCSKQRFAISADGLSIRANQGHSLKTVDLALPEAVPPALLFHGTATRFLDAINGQGLVPGSRQHVHLSALHDTAVAVGARHGKPVVLTVQAGAMHAAGHVFYQADNGVWLTAAVPPAFFSLD